MLNLNCTILSQVVDQAMQSAAAHPRWLKAINRAVVELLSNHFMHREEHGGLLIASSSSTNIYSANGVCQCRAYTYGIPCWHRAASRLVRRHDEALATAETDADQTARVAQLISLSGCSAADARQVIAEFTGQPAAPTFICSWCRTSDYAPSAMQPAWCSECVHATLQGRGETRKAPRDDQAAELDQVNYAAMRDFAGALNMSDMESDHARAPSDDWGSRDERWAAAQAGINEVFGIGAD